MYDIMAIIVSLLGTHSDRMSSYFTLLFIIFCYHTQKIRVYHCIIIQYKYMSSM